MPKPVWEENEILHHFYLDVGCFLLTVATVDPDEPDTQPMFALEDNEGIEIFSKRLPVGTSDEELKQQALCAARQWVSGMLEELGGVSDDHEPLSEDIDYAIETILGGINDGDPDNPYPSHEAVLVAEELRRRFPRKEQSDG